MQHHQLSNSIHRTTVGSLAIVIALSAMPLGVLHAAVDGVIIQPEYPDSDESISIMAHGWFPESCWEIDGSYFSQTDKTIHYYINGYPNWWGGCFFIVIPYSHTRILDPLPMGSYTLIVHDGTGHSMDTVFHVTPWLCCEGIRGNIDSEPGGNLIGDLVYLVDFMFNDGPPPLCLTEADLNGDGPIDIADLVLLVDFMFTGGPAPEECPQ